MRSKNVIKSLLGFSASRLSQYPSSCPKIASESYLSVRLLVLAHPTALKPFGKSNRGMPLIGGSSGLFSLGPKDRRTTLGVTAPANEQLSEQLLRNSLLPYWELLACWTRPKVHNCTACLTLDR